MGIFHISTNKIQNLVVSQDTAQIREGVGIFDNIDRLDAAIKDIEMASFDRAEISVLGSRIDVERCFGESPNPYNLADHPNTPRSILVMPEEKALGIVALIGVGAYAGAVTALLVPGFLLDQPHLLIAIGGVFIGAALGALVAKFLHDKFKKDLDHQIENGGLVLWVRIFDPAKWVTVRRIMKKHGGRYVHMHHIAV